MISSKKMREMFNRLLEHTPCHSQMHYEVISFIRGVAGLGVNSRAMFKSSKPRQKVKFQRVIGSTFGCIPVMYSSIESPCSQWRVTNGQFFWVARWGFRGFWVFFGVVSLQNKGFPCLNFSPRVHRFGLNAWDDLTWNCKPRKGYGGFPK